ncbi:hypothetical protein OCK74_14680 [Chitinophagaceae bacterium LB-8]|uniref:Uncharacterized protein n=1 Tax=Paraflavisolibacter caeni TaxID=2982496 RepID=A0A9X2XPA2_9BACT|nr:hypothetical protein [Paraflavisolibacter caeni]MCU7550364.1 hypothetical protein [Paraflavisolibacter caeni]
MPYTPEQTFYEVMWRVKNTPFPLPWWVQQYFRNWHNDYNTGLFSSKEEAFAANALYRYWSMVGVKDHHQESLIGQAGEIEPVYDRYSVSFFLFNIRTRELYFPQTSGGEHLKQRYEESYLPIIITDFTPVNGISVSQKVLATTAGVDQNSVVVSRIKVDQTDQNNDRFMLCVSVSPYGPTCFQRRYKSGRIQPYKGVSYMKYIPEEAWLSRVNTSWGPVFSKQPDTFGLYGNQGETDPDHYMFHNPYSQLAHNGTLNGETNASDEIAGLCSSVFAWELPLDNSVFELEIKLPVDDYRGYADFLELKNEDPETLENKNLAYWKNKLDGCGLQASLPGSIISLWNLYRVCRANLLILSDNGEIHPGPTIYDSFWIRDSSVEGVACALSGDEQLSIRQIGHHYTEVFNVNKDEWIGPARAYGFFGGEHEKNDREWDSNGQALWAIGRLDRILGRDENFGESLFTPFVIEGCRWIRDNRDAFGLLNAGWSAEHLGEKEKPHYWDDFWAIAGLWEALRLAGRYNRPEAAEIRAIFQDVANATAQSIRWVLQEQNSRGFWETFIPTGPADVGRLDSTIIGVAAYFHPCRLYDGVKLGTEVDIAARMTLYTIWSHFIKGGFRHDSAWNCYGPYLTLQLAHAFLLIGEIYKMKQCLEWTIKAGFSPVSGTSGRPGDIVFAAMGAWNEQHCYPIATDFKEKPYTNWYMGDIPHGWACAEFILLLRDILFFESSEDSNPHIYIAPGILPDWVNNDEVISVKDAPTVFGEKFAYQLTHDKQNRTIEIQIIQAPGGIPFIFPCRFGQGVRAVTVDGNSISFNGTDITLPAGSNLITVEYSV